MIRDDDIFIITSFDPFMTTFIDLAYVNNYNIKI